MKKIILLILGVGLILPVFIAPLHAQTDKELLAELIAEDRSSIDALVLYPADTRLAILEVAMHPEILMRLKGIHNKTQRTFQDLISPYKQEEQRKYYEITRFPDLVSKLVKNGKLRKDEIREILREYPEEIHEDALYLGRKRFHDLSDIYSLQMTADAAFGQIAADYPAEIQESSQALIQLPEVVDILTENMQLTVLAGDVYRQDPRWVLDMVDSLSLEVARQQALEADEWKASLENDPQAKKELEAAAQEYAREIGIDPETYRREEDPVRVYVHYSPFSYWFGYPHWYTYPYWRPYPYWWDWGFYFGPRYNLVVFGLPSFHFVHWHFYHYPYHWRYAHLSDFYYRHYERHQHSRSSVGLVVKRWRSDTQRTFPKNWLADDGKRVERFREYGRLETAYADRQRTAFGKDISKSDFLKQNRRDYPNLYRTQDLRTTRPTKAPIRERERPATRDHDDIYRPPVREPRRAESAPTRERPKVYKRPEYQRKETPPRTEPTTRPPRREPVKRPEEYHKRNWEQQRTPAARPAPSTRQQPARRAPVQKQPAQRPKEERRK